MLRSLFYGLCLAIVLQSCNAATKSNNAVEILPEVSGANVEVVTEAPSAANHYTDSIRENENTNMDGVDLDTLKTEEEVQEPTKTKQIRTENPAPAEPKEPILEEPKVDIRKPDIIEEVSKPDHNAWDALLKKYVSASGRVNYKGFKVDKKQLDKYLVDLKSHPVQADWSRNEKLAYWTNAYNAFTIDVIVRNYPVKSIMDLDKPWDKKFIVINGKNYSLNQIEHEIVRPTFKDPRIHFAFVCAAKSCPRLLNAAYLPETIQAQFDRQTRDFINLSGKNQISSDAVKVSQLFNWYGDDFKTNGSVIDFLNKYTTTKINASAKVEFLEYDWALNE